MSFYTFSFLVVILPSCTLYPCPIFCPVGVDGGISCPMPDVSVGWAIAMSRQSAVSSWSSACFTTVEMRTSRVSSGSSSHHPRMGVNPKHYLITQVGAAFSCLKHKNMHYFLIYYLPHINSLLKECVLCCLLTWFLLPRLVYPSSTRPEGEKGQGPEHIWCSEGGVDPQVQPWHPASGWQLPQTPQAPVQQVSEAHPPPLCCLCTISDI